MKRLAEVAAFSHESPDDARAEAIALNIRSDVRAIFGEGSPEDNAYWNIQLFQSDLPEYVGMFDFETTRKQRGYQDGKKRAISTIENLITRAEEHINERATVPATSGGAVSFADLTNDHIALIKPNGSRHPAKATVDSSKGRIIVFDKQFPVEVGDAIERALPAGRTQMYEVLDPGWVQAPDDEMSHWYMKVRPQVATVALRAPGAIAATPGAVNDGGVTMDSDAAAFSNPDSVQLTQPAPHVTDPGIATAAAGTSDDAVADTSSIAEPSPATPDRYICLAKLGEGVYGEVWRSHDVELKRDVAIKLIRSTGATRREVLEHARALTRVQHPNIVAVYDVVAVADPVTGAHVDAVVMELVEGTTLTETLGHRLDPAEAGRIANALLDAVGAYHARQLAHLDLHDANVIVGPVVKVLDPLFFDTALFGSTATREAQQGRDLRSVRDLIVQILYATVHPDAAARFARDMARPTLTSMRGALAVAFEASRAVDTGPDATVDSFKISGSGDIEIVNLTTAVGFSEAAVAALRRMDGVHSVHAQSDPDGLYRSVFVHVARERAATIREHALQPVASTTPGEATIERSKDGQLVVAGSPAARAVAAGWRVAKVSGDVAYVHNDRVGGRVPNTPHPHSTWMCSRCGSYGPWDGNICRTCGNRESPD